MPVALSNLCAATCCAACSSPAFAAISRTRAIFLPSLMSCSFLSVSARPAPAVAPAPMHRQVRPAGEAHAGPHDESECGDQTWPGRRIVARVGEDARAQGAAALAPGGTRAALPVMPVMHDATAFPR